MKNYSYYYLKLGRGRFKQSKIIGLSNCPWFFKNEVITKIYHDRIEFTNPSIDFRGSLTNINYKNKQRIQFSLKFVDIDLYGTYYILPDDIQEDLLVVYFTNTCSI